MAVRRRSSRSARGQHFLRSSRLAAALVREAGVAEDDLVVDIGAGTGVLTRALLEIGARVVAVERDASLAAGLRARFGGAVSVVEADVLDWRLPEEPFAVVANLPFAGSGAILSHLLRGPVTSAEVIVEWGFAEKHAAIWPATLKGAFWRAFYEVEIARRLDRSAFAPPPSVDAAVLRFTRRTDPLVPTDGVTAVLAVPVGGVPGDDRGPAQRAHSAPGETARSEPTASHAARGPATSTRASGRVSTPPSEARLQGYDDE